MQWPSVVEPRCPCPGASSVVPSRRDVQPGGSLTTPTFPTIWLSQSALYECALPGLLARCETVPYIETAVASSVSLQALRDSAEPVLLVDMLDHLL